MHSRRSTVALLALGGTIGWQPSDRIMITPRRRATTALVTSSCNLDSSEAETTEAATVVEVEAGFQIHMGPTPTRLALERKEQMARVREMNGAIANCFIKVGQVLFHASRFCALYKPPDSNESSAQEDIEVLRTPGLKEVPWPTHALPSLSLSLHPRPSHLLPGVGAAAGRPGQSLGALRRRPG